MFLFHIISVPKSRQKHFSVKSKLMGKNPENPWIEKPEKSKFSLKLNINHQQYTLNEYNK